MEQERIQEIMQQGVAYMIGENYEEAQKKFELCIEADPESVDAYIHLGNAQTNLLKFDEAIKNFKTALMLQPDDGEILFGIGNVYFLKNDYAEAIRFYNKAEKAGYQAEDIYTIMATIFMDAGDFVQAIRMISKAIRLEPLHGELYTQKVAMQLQQKDYEGAEITLQEYQELLPDSYDVYELSAQLYCAQGKYEKAKEILDVASERFPDDPAIGLLSVKYYVDTESYKEASELVKKVMDMEMTEELRRQAILYQATADANLGNVEDVKKNLTAYLEKHQDDEMSFLLLNTYQALKDYEKVRETAQKLVEQGTTESMVAAGKFYYASAQEALEGLAAAQQEYRKLTGELRKMTIKNPGLYEVYIYRLLCHAKLGEYDKALELGDYLVNSQPNMADGHMYKNYIYNLMGDKEKADEEKRMAKEINPQLMFKE